MLGWLFTTKTLVRVTFPGLLTVPVKMRRPRCGVGAVGQLFVTKMRGVVMTGQVVVTLLTTEAKVQESKPRAVTVSVPQKSGSTP